MVQRNLIRNKDKNVSPICKLFFRIVFFVLHNKKIQKKTHLTTKIYLEYFQRTFFSYFLLFSLILTNNYIKM